jgi:hypothetical protein
VQLNFGLDEEYILLGIVSTDPDYKLSLSINNKLNISLQSDKPLEVAGKNGDTVTFSRFSDFKMAPDRTFQLISNRHNKEHFLKRYQKIDYLFQVYISGNEYDPEDLSSQLREVNCITAVFILEPVNIGEKNLQYLTT